MIKEEKAASTFYANENEVVSLSQDEMKMRQTIISIAVVFILGTLLQTTAATTFGRAVKNENKTEIAKTLNAFARKYAAARTVEVKSIDVNGKNVTITASEELEDVPFREGNVAEIYSQLQSFFPDAKNVTVVTNGKAIETLVPEYYKTRKYDKSKIYANKTLRFPLTSPVEGFAQTKGLQGRHIALWQSHGMYFTQETARWEWQRARLFGTVEDLYTQSYVLPFLIPMLENAGANVLIPRERDTHAAEMIIDNDGSTKGSTFKESNGDQSWSDAGMAGFANKKDIYVDGQNPFLTGTVRQVTTIKKGAESKAEWIPEIPEDGTYAVYVSYRTLPTSTDCATYTVLHGGQSTSVNVNQTMGGGTWIYIGSFFFNKGTEGKVTLSNISYKAGKIITADAVKIGGGMGNVARAPKDTTRFASVVSGYPRYVEGSRYWLQWAGFPDSVYSESHFTNDYNDDYRSRGHWVNYLKNIQNVPVDMSFAFHSDAGITPDDSIIGTLGIYTSHQKDGSTEYPNGLSRETSRDLTDLVQTQIVSDVRHQFSPEWSRRGMWNQSYYESRVPDVPAMLLELLSHQNFSDMRYGLDPRFRFTVSRAIYKGILRYIGRESKKNVIVEPLAPSSLHATFAGETEVKIAWKATPDSLEPTADPNAYLLYTRINDGAFDNGKMIHGTETKVTIRPDQIYSFKVVAVNEGGRSFPSEIVSVCRNTKEKGTVMIVNGFDRLSAPASFEAKQDSLAGFLYDEDHGVAYQQDISFVGDQYSFHRNAPWITNDDNGFGDCYNDYTGKTMAGNTFDYPYMHGKSMKAAGYSFVTSSEKAVVDGTVKLADYRIVDLILGKQRATTIGNCVRPVDFQTFPEDLQKALTDYCKAGRSLIVTGAYVLSDLQNTPEGKSFAKNVLKCTFASSNASRAAVAASCVSAVKGFNGSYRYCNTPNPHIYCAERVNGMTPADKKASSVLRYTDNNIGAAVAYDGDYRNFVMGFPFETILDESSRDQLMGEILGFFSSSTK